MRKWIIVLAFMLGTSAYAQPQCGVDIQNEVRLDGQQVEIHSQQAKDVLIDAQSNLFIDGVKVNLDAAQQQALDAYRTNMNTYLPRARELARSGVELLKSILDDLAVSLESSEAFNKVKRALDELLRSFEQRYQKGDQFVLQQAAFSDFYANWREDLALAQETVNAEFFSSAFDLLSQSMREEGGLNLMALKESMLKLQARLSGEMEQQSSTMQQQASQYCDDLQQVAEQEKKLHDKIPELKGYQVFLI